MNKKLKIEFISRTGEMHPLYFNIYDSKLARRWINIFLKNQVNENKKLTYRFTNTTYKNIDRVRQDLYDCVIKINNIYDSKLPWFDNKGELSEFELNALHEEFEKYGDRINYLVELQSKAALGEVFWTKELHENFLKLNELIHLHEDVVKSNNNPFPNMAVLVDYYPQDTFQPILESDKIWLQRDFKWGGLYLGYNTLGKDWLKVNADNDLEVIERDQVRPQERFSAETWINFGPDCSDYHRGLHIEKWLADMPYELRKKVPIDNLNKFCFGRFKIGQLITNYKYFMDFDPDQRNWQVPNSDTKLAWNDQIFTSFESIRYMEIMDHG